MQTVLVIGKESQEVCQRLQDRRFLALGVASSPEGLRIHRQEGADLVLVLLPLDDASGAEVIGKLLAQDPRAVVVVCGQDDGIKGAPGAIEAGAFEYLPDPINDHEGLIGVVGLGLGARRSDAQLRFLRRKDAEGASWQTMVGQSPAMREVFAVVRRICHRTTRSAAPAILITGETGTGKGLLAKAIHYNSIRRSRAFVDINCAALPPGLVEAELFGHTKGAYTDARSSRAGLFETADGGSIFLDEIGAIPPDLQVKLLTAIEDKTMRRLGATEDIRVDVQMIAATNRDLASMVEHGSFRADLYHRLAGLAIEIPPLRAREDDRLLLAEEFIRAACREYGVEEKQLGQDARRAILSYPWPGNVRELRNIIERIVLLEEGKIIHTAHLRLQAGQKVVDITSDGDEDSLIVSLPEGGFSLEALECEVIRKALERNKGNVSHTARYLDISRHTLIYRMKKHGLG